MFNLDLTLPQIFPLLSMVFILGLGFVVLLKNEKNILNRLFFLISVTFAIWMIGTFMMFISSRDQQIIFWDRFIYIGVVFMPALQYHFSLIFTYINKRREKFLIIAYILSSVFLVLSRTDYFVADVFRYRWGVHTEARFLHHFFMIFFFFYIFALLYNFYLQYKRSAYKAEKQKIIYLIISFAILNLVGGIGYLPAYKISIFSPISLIAPSIFSILISYAIIRHRLMDIKIVMRKYSVFLTSLVSILVASIIVAYMLARYFPGVAYWSDLIILVFAISAFPYIKEYYYRLANKYFFSSLYDAREVILEISDKLRSTLDLNEIFNIIHLSLDNALHVKSFGILRYDSINKNYIVLYNHGFPLKQRDRIRSNQELHKKYIAKAKVLILEEIKQDKNNVKIEELFKTFDNLRVEVITPLNVKDKTVGIIILGIKESGDMYNKDDLQVLEIIGAQAAIAVENAQLYEEARRFNIKLKAEVKAATKELLIANERLKKLDASKSEFISIASHQLRTPLTVIKGYISMIIDGDFGDVTALAQDSLEKVYESNERLIQLVENLLNISRIESDRLKFSFAVMPIEKVVDSVVEELQNTAKKKGLVFEYKRPKKPLPKVKIDEEKIRQVIMNLIDNSIKYTKKGSITVSLKSAGKNIEFCVSDSGIGINEDDKSNLFKKFSRGSGSSLVHTEGTGLGLYVAKKMIELHHGRIWAESNGKNKGSRFIFTIPINR